MARPTTRDGLKVRETREISMTLLRKHVWSLIHDSNKLWAQLVLDKYLKGNFIFHSSSRHGISYSWVSIVKATKILQPGFKFHVGEGALSVWFYLCCPQGPLCNLVNFVHISDSHLEIKDIYNNGMWNWNLLASPLKNTIRDLINCIFLNNDEG